MLQNYILPLQKVERLNFTPRLGQKGKLAICFDHFHSISTEGRLVTVKKLKLSLHYRKKKLIMQILKCFLIYRILRVLIREVFKLQCNQALTVSTKL